MLKIGIGICICMLLISTSVFSAAGTIYEHKSSISANDTGLTCDIADESTQTPDSSILLVGDDVIVAESTDDEYEPQIACASNGDLYIVFENLEADKVLDIYKSVDDGKSWSWYIKWSASGLDLTDPSIAIGEGDENWLFITSVLDGTELIVIRHDLNNPSTWDITTITNDGFDVFHPRIITDSVEYDEGWFPYLIYNKGTLTDADEYALRFTRSVDYGDTWDSSQYLHWYSDEPYYHGDDAHPDIAYGSNMVVVAFDDYDHNDDERDIHTIYSNNFGSTWSSSQKVADNDNIDEFDPSVAVVRDYATARTTLIAYTHEFSGTDNDIYYAYSENAGSSWNINNVLANSVENEEFSDVATSDDKGAFHAVYWKNNDIIYQRSPYDTPADWTSPIFLNEDNSATQGFGPSIVTNPLRSVDKEAAITWTDFRKPGTQNDIYFDSLLKEPPQIPILKFQTIEGGLLGVSVELINSGEATAFDISWELVIVDGMLGPLNATVFIPFRTNGEIASLASGESAIISTPMVGIGKATLEYYCDYTMIINGSRTEVDVTVKEEGRDRGLLLVHTFPEDEQPNREWIVLEEHEYEYTYDNNVPVVKFDIDESPRTMHLVQVRDSTTQDVRFLGACKLIDGQGVLEEQWITKGMVENQQGTWEVELVTY